ncbi:glycosyl transferase family protein [Mycobacteroides abscessus subsp. abscessus]|nr:glycosyl transferase family protein [Mycobacteroides abscessus subsp. abscessus]
MAQTVCLNMIVRDERHVIGRCLESVKGLIDYWVIVDTGSTDGTPELIDETLAGIPGELHHRPWRDFGTNRTEAVELARGKADFMLIIDADEQLVVPDGFRWPVLDLDCYSMLHSNGVASNEFWRDSMLRDSCKWRFVGVRHEYPQCDGERLGGRLEGPRIVGHFDGHRSQAPQVAKYSADAAALEQALADEPDNARYVFYLAQSYRDAGNLQKAIEVYERRFLMGGWDEEVWYSLYQCACIAERLNFDEAVVIHLYMRAYDVRPTRAEPVGNLARYLREHNHMASARLYAAAGLGIEKPRDAIFLELDYYTWRCLDELAVADYWLGNYRDSADACQELLASSEVPEAERPRIKANLDFALQKMPTDAPNSAKHARCT